MFEFWLWLFFVVCLGCIAHSLRSAERIYEPLLPMATVFLGFVWIQLHGLGQVSWSLPGEGLAKTTFMSLLCLVCFWWGYSRRILPLRLFSGDYDNGRLLLVSFGLTLFGATFYFMISRLPEALLQSSQPTGKLVALNFFAQTLSYGFALACLLWAKFKDKRALLVALFGACFYLDRIILAGRRADAAEFFFIVVLSLFFGRGFKIPRWVMLSVMIAMVLMIQSTGTYRNIASEAGWDAPFKIGRIDFIQNLENIFESGGEEMTNAVYVIESHDLHASFDFGTSHWNQLVFNYVPAQLLGGNFKSHLQFQNVDIAEQYFRYSAKTGSTLTGMVDSFSSFWYFGAIKFLLVGYLIRKIWNGAKFGSFVAQIFYMLMITKTLHVVTHSTQFFLSPWVHMSIFLMPFLLWARLKAKTENRINLYMYRGVGL
jgi:hypothetical protein